MPSHKPNKKPSKGSKSPPKSNETPLEGEEELKPPVLKPPVLKAPLASIAEIASIAASMLPPAATPTEAIRNAIELLNLAKEGSEKECLRVYQVEKALYEFETADRVFREKLRKTQGRKLTEDEHGKTIRNPDGTRRSLPLEAVLTNIFPHDKDDAARLKKLTEWEVFLYETEASQKIEPMDEKSIKKRVQKEIASWGKNGMPATAYDALFISSQTALKILKIWKNAKKSKTNSESGTKGGLQSGKVRRGEVPPKKQTDVTLTKAQKKSLKDVDKIVADEV